MTIDIVIAKQNNAFARIGRKLVPIINTENEHPLDHIQVERLAHENGLQLLDEQGLCYLSGALAVCYP